MSRLAWISWEQHRRTSEICDYLGIRPVVIEPAGRSWRKYPGLILRTLRVLWRLRPDVLIVQNPSIVLALLAVLYRPFGRYKLIVDADNEAVNPYTHSSGFIRRVAAWLLSKADLTVVTNDYLVDRVTQCGGCAVVLPDRLPAVPAVGPAGLPADTFNIVLIATYAADEPVAEIIEAATRLQDRLTLHVTGNAERLPRHYRDGLPAAVRFTGFLSDRQYWSYLIEADAIVDLTLKDNCLVCGAYEGVAAATPLLLSDNAATVQYFDKGVVYTDNSVDDIHRAMLQLMDHHARLKTDIERLRAELPARWQQRAEVFRRQVDRLLVPD